MSKHLRFKNLLGVVAIMLTLSMSWSQASAQNLSSEKEMLTFTLDGQTGSTLDQATRTVTVTFAFGEVVTGKIATFTSSEFSNVYVGANPLGILAVSGTSPATDYSGGPVTWTVEAENSSYDNYTVKVEFEAPATGKDLLSFAGDYDKHWATGCAAATNPVSGTAPGAFAGTAVTMDVPYGTDVTMIVVDLSVSVLATCSPADGATVDFTAPVNFTVTAQDGSTQVYTVTAVVGPPSEQDYLLAFDVTGGTVSIDHANQTIAVEVPFSTVIASIVPTWSISDYAIMLDDNGGAEICSGVAVVGAMASYNAGAGTASFWIVAEDPSEVSEYVVTFTNAPASDENEIISLDVEYTKTWGVAPCVSSETVVVTANISGTDVTINLPFGVTTVNIDDLVISDLAGAVPAAGALVDGGIITVTAEDGSVEVYDIIFDNAMASNAKVLMGYEFDDGTNNGAGFTNWSMPYVGAIDQSAKRVLVYVAWDTDLHDLIALFTNSDYSTVYVAESTSVTGDPTTYTPQCSDVTINDHSNSLTYVIVAEDGTEERYDVTVLKETALDGNELIGFTMMDFDYCLPAMGTYDVAGVYDGLNITVSVKYGTDVTALSASYTLSDGATVVVSGADYTNPVTYTVTAENGDVAVYTVTVVVRDQNSAKQLKSYWFDSADNAGFGGDAIGTINETAKTVHVWIPWDNRGSIDNLVASFTLSSGAVMTRSEDTQFIQESGVDANDFTTPIAYTVWAEDCSTVEYFVTVFVTPNTDIDISAFTFDYTDCGCDLVNKVDPYAKRIYITLPYTVSISSLAPTSIVIDPDATISPAASVAQNWTTGSKFYTVTGPADPQTGVKASAVWEVIVENPPCQETDILAWEFNGGVQVGSAVINKDNHTVDVVLKNGTNLTNMTYSISMSCDADICCNSGACAGINISFSEDAMCHTCVVTAQDESITQDWTICVEFEDVVDPEVITWSVMSYNCDDSVAVQSNEWGHVFIVHESVVNPDACNCDFDLWDFSDHGSVADLVGARLGAYASVDTLNGPVYVMTHGLYSGAYYAFAVDETGNVSCVSKQKLYLDMCDVDVADLCELRGMPPVWKFTITGEVLVSYEETRAGGNLKYVQDAGCGIKIIDSNGGLSTAYGVGKGLTNLKGMVYPDGCEMVFVPVCCYDPTVSSSGNVITPIELTYEEFFAQSYINTGSQAYEGMLVRITTPMIAFDDYGLGYTTWEYDGLDLATVNAKGDYEWFLNKVFNANYVGEEIPTVPTIYQGIRTDVNWGACFGLITPRSKDDIIKVTAGSLIADPDPATIAGVAPGQCGTVMIDLINEGIGNLPITALYLDDVTATDEFELILPAQVPFTLGTWEVQDVQVDFCPTNAGAESTMLVVEYGVGLVLEVLINGTTVTILPTPYCTSFENKDGQRTGWTNSGDNTFYAGWTTNSGSSAIAMRWAGDKWWQSPALEVSGSDPVLQYYEGAIFAGSPDSREILVSDDFGVSWDVAYSYPASVTPETYFAGNPFKKHLVSLAAYSGKTIQVRFQYRDDQGGGNSYWIVDDVCVMSRVTSPVFVGLPDPVEFGGVQVNETGTSTFNVSNSGISVLKVTKVELVGGADFSLVDANAYPVEVTSGTEAFAVNGTEMMSVDVLFTPSDIGVQNATLKVTYGMYANVVVEIPVSGEGLSCYTAAEAVLGENFSYQNAWWTYTAEKFQMAYVNSCDPRNTTDPYEYSYDTWLYIYSDCEGTLIAENDDLEWDACPYNRASSGLLVPMMEGESIKIFWPWAFSSAHDADGFYFHIEATYPIDGDVCETAIALTLPVVNHFGTTVGFEDDYDMSPCSPYSNYMDGNDKVYMITLETEGYLTGNILGAYGSIHVLDKCPIEELEKKNCKAFVGGPNGGEFTKRIVAGEYYVIVSTWAPPQTVDYLLNMSFEEGSGINDNSLMSSLSVYPNPTNGKFTVSISNADAMDLTVELVNISGQVVYRNEVSAVYSYNEDIDASDFAKGVYYLKVNNGEEVKVEKVVVQ